MSKRPLPHWLLSVVAMVVLAAPLAARPALAWRSGGTTICDAAQAQQVHAACGDMIGGVYVAWIDRRNGTDDVYLQRLTAGGELSAGWPAGGRVVIQGGLPRKSVQLVSDGASGVLIAWLEARVALPSAVEWDVRVLRLTPAGARVAGWPAAGAPVTNSFVGQQRFSMAPDGAGGAYFAWDEFVEYELHPGHSIREDRLFAQHLLGNGVPPPAWSEQAALLATLTGDFVLAAQVIAGGGPAYVSWSAGDFAQVAQLGAMSPNVSGWPVASMSSSDGGGIAPVPIAPDGVGGVIVGRVGSFAGSMAFRSRRLSSTGGAVTGWPETGVTVDPTILFPNGVRMMSDGAHGAFLAWIDDLGGGTRPFTQRMTGAGAVHAGWDPNGTDIAGAPVDNTAIWATRDYNGGMYVAWRTAGTLELNVRRVRDGVVDVAWPSSGSQVSPGPVSEAVLMEDGSGGAFLFWSDDPTGNPDVYGVRIGADGVVPSRASLQEAVAEPGLARLVWWTPERAGAWFAVERRTDASEWAEVARVQSGAGGRLEFEDRDVRAGRYGYRARSAGWAEPFGEAWVEVPAAYGGGTLAVTPNPSAGRFQVEFVATPGAPARVQLIDVRGRLVAVASARGTAGGMTKVEFGRSVRLAPGVYLVLAPEEVARAARVCVLP